MGTNDMDMDMKYKADASHDMDASSIKSSRSNNNANEKQWIRGVNLGGWLMAERFLTPYLFAVNSCHLKGDLCWYPGQVLSSPLHASFRHEHEGTSEEDDSIDSDTLEDPYAKYNTSNICQPSQCHPFRPILQTHDGNSDYHPLASKPFYDYPVDEWTLGQAFQNRTLAQMYMERHWDTFVTRNDLLQLAQAGVTHMRVPMSFWMRGNVVPGEPWIPGAWPYFVRMCGWAREYGIQVWADLHGAPGSENGFDNSGRYTGGSDGGQTCLEWSGNAENVQRTVEILTDFVTAMAEEGLQDVVTGFGLLNEPFFDCDEGVLREYYTNGLKIVRTILGPETSVFVGDMFDAGKFNDGFWTDSAEHYKTYLDSHPYHVFFEQGRAFTPRQHIAYVCRAGAQEVQSCCYEPNIAQSVNTVNMGVGDPPPDLSVTKVAKNPSHGIGRIIGEWAAAYDVLPTALTPHIMKTIAAQGVAPLINRTLSPARQDFMKHFVKAQMVTYESKDSGLSSGWLFWNFKVEGGAFAEWDFLRGIREGWIPILPPPNVASQDLYGTCLDIYNQTNDDYNAIVDEYPDPRTLDWKDYQGWDATDDFVLSDPNIPISKFQREQDPSWRFWNKYFPAILIVLMGIFFSCRKRLSTRSCCGTLRQRSSGYEELK